MVLTCGVGETTPAGLIEAMVGREVSQSCDAPKAARGELLLEVQGLKRSGPSGRGVLRVHRGEVLGLAGLVGAGRTELVSGLYGLTRSQAGTMRFKGRTLRVRHPAVALKAGLAMVTEDRQRWGLVGAMSVEDNLLLSTSGEGRRGWWLDRSRERELVKRWTKSLRIKIADPTQSVGELSGGNQQKVVLGRALITQPELLILDEPTRGIDVAAKAEIYRLVRELRDAGVGILLVSSELPELLALSDRILVMCQGRLAGELAGDVATESAVLALAMPQPRSAAEGINLPSGETARPA